ncbi:hypothetical protein DM01DRAFT_1336486 [Hesseltinella vesiculosa]|uniref:Galactose oxidase n=1 Tax=Hesseltinella vesiculosa TaxID=101127 RepID=A0A1X2GGL7_9FUNG|nr:hypothetical protein DM01DRAFT_1336486 [Hesseltinella vesiculosa]
MFIPSLVSLTLIVTRVLAQCTTPGPSQRTFYSLAAVKNSLYLAGGSTTVLDIWKLDMTQGVDTNCPAWVQVSAAVNASSVFGPFVYGAMVPDEAKNQLLIFAGDTNANTTSMPAGPISFDLTQKSFVTGSVNNPGYEARAVMSATLDTSGKIWIYGGRHPITFGSGGTLVSQSDYYNYDLTTSPLSGTADPVSSAYGNRPGRWGHTTTLVNNKLFTLGGFIQQNGTAKNIVDFASAQVFDISSKQAMAMATIGDIPPTLSGFSAVAALDGHSIIVFGGVDTSNAVHSNVYILDTCTLTWHAQPTSGQTSNRVAHSAYMFGKYMITMLGVQSVASNDNDEPTGATVIDNVAILDTSTFTWVSNFPAGYTPETVKTSPTCTFAWPSLPTVWQAQGTDPMPYDNSVISNPYTASFSVPPPLTDAQKGGVGIGVPLFVIACAAAAFYVYRRRQKQKARPTNPRWTGIISHSSASLASRQPAAGVPADYPLSTYSPSANKDLRTYTAADHDIWEQQLMQDSQHSSKNETLSRHEDIWAQMRGLHAPGDQERR